MWKTQMSNKTITAVYMQNDSSTSLVWSFQWNTGIVLQVNCCYHFDMKRKQWNTGMMITTKRCFHCICFGPWWFFKVEHTKQALRNFEKTIKNAKNWYRLIPGIRFRISDPSLHLCTSTYDIIILWYVHTLKNVFKKLWFHLMHWDKMIDDQWSWVMTLLHM